MGEDTEAQTRVKLCELCGSEAELHCAADSAFLCRSCDAKIHSSNFLVARHLRSILCHNCKSFTGKFVSGPISPESPRKVSCDKPCSSISSPTWSSSSFSSCCSSLDPVSSSELSSTEGGENRTASKKSMRRRTRRMERRGGVRVGVRCEADGIFVNWCDELGLRGKSRVGVVSSASWAMGVLMEKPMVPSYRVRLTASFWFGMRVSTEAMTWQNLRRLQELSGVPGKMIVAVEMRLSRALRLSRRLRVDLREGWAETDGA